MDCFLPFFDKKKLPVRTNNRNHFLEACKENAGTASYWPSSSLSLCFLASSSSRFRLASISLRCLSSSSFRCFQVVYSLCLASDMCCSLVLCPDNCCALVLRSWKYDCFIYGNHEKVDRLLITCKRLSHKGTLQWWETYAVPVYIFKYNCTITVTAIYKQVSPLHPLKYCIYFMAHCGFDSWSMKGTLYNASHPFDPKEWPASNFSLKHHPWITHKSQEDKGHDNQLKKLDCLNLIKMK